MDKIEKINDTLVNLFDNILKEEEKTLSSNNNRDLSITEIHTLVAIGEINDATITSISKKLKISVSTLTIAINKLAQKGLVEKIRSQRDRRIVRANLTEEALKIVESHGEYHRSMVKNAIDNLTEEEIDRFSESIEKIAKYIKE